MIANYLKLTFRNLIKNKLFSMINIAGFAISMACVVLILLFVSHELNYDRHWEKSDRTYKVMTSFLPNASYAGLEIAMSGSIISVLLKQDYPQVEETVRIVAGDNIVLALPDTDIAYAEPAVVFADASFPDVFDVPLLAGSWQLDQPAQIILNETLAQKYFGDSDPVGRQLYVANATPMTVTAVMQDLDDNTHIAANAIISMATAEAFFGRDYTYSWTNQSFHTYMVLSEGSDVTAMINSMPEFLQRYASDDPNDNTALEIMPVTDIHLRSNREYEIRANGSLTTVYSFSALASFVLLLACFNFMNLSTARSVRRAKEVGMRKALGAHRRQLVQQFLGESIAVACMAIVVAIGLVELVLPLFNATIDLQVGLDYFGNPLIVLGLLLMAIGVGLLAGSYPAVVMSSFSAISMLKGTVTKGKKGAFFRQVLVVLQFSISIALIIAAIVVISQLRFTRSLDLGFTTDQIAVFRARGAEGLGTEFEAMKQELLRHPDILEVTRSDLMPGDLTASASGLRAEGAASAYFLPAIDVSYDFFETFDIRFLSGRAFSRDRNDLYREPTSQEPITQGNFILNEAAVAALGLDLNTAVGTQLEEQLLARDFEARVNGAIVGVIENIYFESLHEEVQPLFFRLKEYQTQSAALPLYQRVVAQLNQMAVRFSGNNMSDALDHADQVWRQFLPGSPVQRRFLDDKFAEIYAAEQRQGTIFSWFSVAALFITGIGLYGLAAFVTEQRTREIGIRKVLGSTALGIVALLSRDFGKLVVIANLIAWPIAWFAMNDWLQQFAYRIELAPWIFATAGTGAMLLAVAAVGTLALKAANQNPIRSLRYE